MAIDVSCPNGHHLNLPADSAGGVVACPQCGRSVSVPAARMSAPSGLAASGDDSADSASEEVATVSRSLWRVMGGAARIDNEPQNPQPPLSGGPADADASSAEASDQPPRKSLWQIMPRQPGRETSSPPAAASPPCDGTDGRIRGPKDDQAAGDGETNHEAADEWSSEFPVWEPPVLAGADPSAFADRIVIRSGRSRTAVVSLLLGAAAVPCSAFALVPQVWAGMPATVLGFAALVLGWMALGEIHRSRGRQTGRLLAAVGMVSGIGGMFLGPLLFARVGADWQQARDRRETMANLESIGAALDAYHDAHGKFPAGGIAPAGPAAPGYSLHSWATALLPYLGEESLYRQIDLSRPFDDDVNFSAMSRDVPAFFAAGADRSKTRRGYAVMHFAGVGGELATGDGRRVRAGIFDRRTGMNRAEISDGLSQTLVAGEISHRFPPWGEPGNWRSIGPGLNKHPAGFGNAEGTGAMFLKADGSVRFYSNKTSPDILQRLATPDAGDSVPSEFR
jgi:hypothetical protein